MAAGLEIKATYLIWHPTHLQNVSDVKRRFKCRLANQGNISNLRPFLIVSKTFDGFSSASSRLLFLILVDMIPPMMPPPTTIHIFPSSSRSLEKRGLGIGRRLSQWKKKVSLLEFPPHPWCVQFSIFLKRLGGLGFWLGTHIHVLVCHKWKLVFFFSMFFFS